MFRPFRYELDAVGNITKATELDGTAWTYAYDNRYRLTSAAEGTKARLVRTATSARCRKLYWLCDGGIS